VGVDAARDHDLPRGVDDPAGAKRGEASRRADRDDALAVLPTVMPGLDPA
jgi:hypothetical protein